MGNRYRCFRLIYSNRREHPVAYTDFSGMVLTRSWEAYWAIVLECSRTIPVASAASSFMADGVLLQRIRGQFGNLYCRLPSQSVFPINIVRHESEVLMADGQYDFSHRRSAFRGNSCFIWFRRIGNDGLIRRSKMRKTSYLLKEDEEIWNAIRGLNNLDLQSDSPSRWRDEGPLRIVAFSKVYARSN